MGDVIPAGAKVSSFYIKRALSWGGSAVVYEAFDSHLKRLVALKVMSSFISSDPVFKKRFKREGWIHSSLEHPNIVPVYAADESEEYGFWIAMKLMKGGSLESLFKKSEPLDPRYAIDLLEPIAAALDFAHDQGQVHRDVKPENILLSEDGIPCLTDFGIAKSMDGSRLTLTGKGIGTPGYMAPEQIKGKRVDRRADVYSLAVVLYKCLTGEVPLPRADGIRRGRLHITQGVPPASERNPRLPQAIDSVIRVGMATRRHRRPAKASTLIGEAREVLAKPATRPAHAASRWTVRGALLTSVITVVLGFVGIGFGAATSSSPRLAQAWVATDGVALRVPGTWERERGRPAVSGLAIFRPIDVRSPPRPSGSRLSVIAGLSAVTGASLLPPAYRSQLNGHTRRVPVALGSLEAYRYAFEAPLAKTPVTVFVAPTTRGVVTLACRLPGRDGDRAMARFCWRIASTLTLRKGAPYALGPSPSFAKTLHLRFAKLAKRRAADRGDLNRASDPDGQGVAADDMADAFKAAAKGLASLRLSPESARARARLVEALRSTRDAYKDLAVAARQEDRARYRDAAAAVEVGEEAIRASTPELRELGYRPGATVQKSAPAGVSPP